MTRDIIKAVKDADRGWKCARCGKRSPVEQGTRAHFNAVHGKRGGKLGTTTDKRALIDALDSIGEDLPDGAYFALAAEMGIEPEDFL